MSNLKNTILEGAKALWPEMVSLRRHFHANPELSYKEYETAAFVCSYLERQGIPFRNGIAGTGIIATIEGNLSGKRVMALRAELDALPINEENDVEYRSRNKGVMHACGHDAHMAMLLGSAVLLNRLKDSFGGKVLLVFQPGEEKSPGGASLMIESGAFDETPPDMVIAQHILPELETGCVGYRSGSYMASADEIYLTVRGKGGHAALSREVTDQIYIASELVLTLKDTIAAEQSGRKIPTVFGIGRITGEGATNVIPASVEIA
jgi:amidohydrolase